MTFQEIQRAVYDLSSQEQVMLLETLVDAINQRQSQSMDRQAIVEKLRGCLKQPGQSGLSDREVEQIREERRVKKYLR